MKFSDLLHASVQLRPRLIRPEQAALVLGSGELVADFVFAGWLRPAISQHRMVLYPLLLTSVPRFNLFGRDVGQVLKSEVIAKHFEDGKFRAPAVTGPCTVTDLFVGVPVHFLKEAIARVQLRILENRRGLLDGVGLI